uniref:(northern house mosquito) hypothetical protein n=1 Tax=Culex pipiens TaxID=7175 RepID=A0A8D8BBL4_CULPI
MILYNPLQFAVGLSRRFEYCFVLGSGRQSFRQPCCGLHCAKVVPPSQSIRFRRSGSLTHCRNDQELEPKSLNMALRRAVAGRGGKQAPENQLHEFFSFEAIS